MTLSAAGNVRAILVFTDLRIVCVLDVIENCLIVICYVDGLANNFVIYQNQEVNDIEYKTALTVSSYKISFATENDYKSLVNKSKNKKISCTGEHVIIIINN